MRGKRILSLFFLLSFCLGFGIKVSIAEMKFIQITSGPVGGTYYILGGALADLLKDSAEGVKFTVTTGGSLGNISKIEADKAEIGFTMDRLAYEAANGIGEYEGKGKHQKVMGLTYLCEIYMSLFLISEEFPINSIKEIKDKKVKIRILSSPRASSPSVAGERLLNAYGITFKDIEDWGGKVNFVSYSEAANLLKDGHADVWLGPMVPPILEWTVSKKVKILPAESAVLESLKKEHKYGVDTIPAGYWDFIKQPIQTMTESILIAISKKISDDVVYKIAKTINTHPDTVRKVHRIYETFDPKRACNINGIPLHPGAVKYYKEIGIPCN